jgi:hypothetical protein
MATGPLRPVNHEIDLIGGADLQQFLSMQSFGHTGSSRSNLHGSVTAGAAYCRDGTTLSLRSPETPAYSPLRTCSPASVAGLNVFGFFLERLVW